jgi:adenine deaminase
MLINRRIDSNRYSRLRAVFAAAMLAVCVQTYLYAAEPNIDAAASVSPNWTQLILAGRLLDRPGTPARGPSTLVIRDGRIVAVHDGLKSAASLDLPAETAIVDLSSKFVLPGLIDSHVHLDSDLAGVEGLV